MRRSRAVSGRIFLLISCLVAFPLLGGCGSPAVETPSNIPAAPQEASKSSFQALSGKPAPKPAPPK